MSDLAAGSMGPETTYDLAFTGGALTFTIKYAGADATISAMGSISVAQLMTALEAKITNPTEKAIVTVVGNIISAIP